MIHLFKCVLLIVVAFATVVKVVTNLRPNPNVERFIGENCFGPDNEPGICALSSECTFVLLANETTKRKFLNLQINCAFSGEFTKDFVVCCPKETAKNFALNACKRYGKKPDATMFLDLKIFEGEEAEPAEFPYFAALRSKIDEKSQFICGGVLISEDFVLTAAHCAVKSRKLFSVRLGKTSLNETKDDEFLGVDVAIKV